MVDVEVILRWSIPGGTLAVVAAGVFEMWRQRRRRRSGAPVTATYVNEVTAMLYGTKRMEMDHRESMSMMRDELPDGSPPRVGLDLDRGVVLLREGTPPPGRRST